MACDMPEPCKFPSLDSCQKRFLWTHKEVDLAPHPVVGLVLQVEDAEKFPQALSFESLDPFFHSQQAGSIFKKTTVLPVCIVTIPKNDSSSCVSSDD